MHKAKARRQRKDDETRQQHPKQDSESENGISKKSHSGQLRQIIEIKCLLDAAIGKRCTTKVI
jgi:hypothetical protein